MRSIGLFVFIAGLVSVSSCTVPPDADDFKPCPIKEVVGGNGGEGGSSSANGGASASGGANAGGAGGSGGAVPECVMDSDCAGVLDAPDPRCGALRCTVEQKCAVEITEGPIASQRYGDCKQGYCDGAGHFLQIDDVDDYFNDSNPCTIDFCQADGSINMILPDGSPCPGLGDGYCYQGQCVECIDTDPGATCKVGGYACDFFWCVDFAQCQGNQCGGACAPCPAGVGCQQDSDCMSGVCNGGMCALSSCMDGVKNDDESGIDCGGANCLPCPDGEGCAKHADCVSQVCMFATCQAPSCFDGVQNGDEAGIDCGGASCPACSPLP